MHNILELEGSPIVVNTQVTCGITIVFWILSGSKMDLPSKKGGATLVASLEQVSKSMHYAQQNHEYGAVVGGLVDSCLAQFSHVAHDLSYGPQLTHICAW